MTSLHPRCAVVGRGRLGTALAHALDLAGFEVDGPLGRGATGADADVVILCVPDGEIAAATTQIAPGRLVGHCSGATTLAPLAPHEAFSLHPLMTVITQPGPSAFAAAGTGEDGATGTDFAGAPCAVAGSTERALNAAYELAGGLGMNAFTIADEDRAACHAAASIASNFLVTLEWAAERLATSAGADRDILVPLVRATVNNWAASGPHVALTGPIARGDEETVANQRAAIAQRTPDLLRLFDALATATRRLAAETDETRVGGARRTRGPRMRTIRTIPELRAALHEPRRHGRSIGLVPTMGALHEGHLSLVRRAREECDEVVVSLFVNPAQFEDAADLDGYPRDERRDTDLAAKAGADILFAPAHDEVYPPGFATTVVIQGPLTETLEGAHRGTQHFHGVTTVVTKLLNMVAPDVAYFGQKDAQQALVIRKLANDLDMPVRIEVGPTVREPDGLALSSRNLLLSDKDRRRALALSRALQAAARAVEQGETDADAVTAAAQTAMTDFEVQPEYLALVDPQTLAPVRAIDGDVLVAVAARVGESRLIDNVLIHPNGSHS